jgi:D-proline reductase (dithiol) PrdB
MITRDDAVPLAPLRKPLRECRLTFVSTAGVRPKGTLPLDTVHPIGDYTFRRVPSAAKPADRGPPDAPVRPRRRSSRAVL